MSSLNPQQSRRSLDNDGIANATGPSTAQSQAPSNQNVGDVPSALGLTGGNTASATRPFPFSGGENVFIPTTFGGLDPMTNAHAGPVVGPPGLPMTYVPDYQIPPTGLEIATRPQGRLDGEHHNNGMKDLVVGTVLSQQITNAIRGGAEGKIIEYYCVPEVDRDVGIIPTRHLKCTGVPGDTSPSNLKSFFEQFGDISGLFVEKLMSNGFLYVSFFNLQAAIHCFRDVQTKWPAVYCVRTTLENVVNNFAAHPLTTEGEVQVDVLNGHCDTQTIVGALGAFGDLHTVQTYRNNESCTVFAEFYDIRHAAAAIHHLTGQQVEGLEVRLNWPDVERIAWTKASQMIEIHEDQNVCVVHAGSTQLVNDARRLYGVPFASGSGSGHSQISGPRNQYGGSTALTRGHSGAMTLYEPESPRYDPGINRNIVDLYNVRNGIDLRTTIMIRNIPNHLPQSVIKAWLDEVSYRKYDFLYLRIDFANHCNVGYCFVNYLNLEDIVDFAQKRVGTRWSQFGSDKIVEISYANIQGKAALIEKFRNSSVMDQPFEFRPRAFHSTGESFGLDMVFPPPNNLNRKLRSVTAAEHSGLYNPRSRNGYNGYQPARFGGFGYNRGRGYNNFGSRPNSYGTHMGGAYRAPQTNRLAITMPGYEPAPYVASARGPNNIPPAGNNGFGGMASANGGFNTLPHGSPAQAPPPRAPTSFGVPRVVVTSPEQFQPAAYPAQAQSLHPEPRVRQENVPPRPRSGVRTQGAQVRPQSALSGAGSSAATNTLAPPTTTQFPHVNAGRDQSQYGPQTPSMRYDSGQPGGSALYNSPLSPAGLVNAGFVPSNPAHPGFSASTFTNAFGEGSSSAAQNNRSRSPDYDTMSRNIDALRRLWEQ
ncbi:hypothetical protein TWF481_005395 [Arthrobotrys musiformis]|uniref:RRM domain-containing protein n=1 Tax=Arthrobotrys musiformis TaxID=47236 RepID=A0AAV9WDM7_9PEZI